MIGFASLNSQAIRTLLRQPPRHRIFLPGLTSLPSSTATSASNCRYLSPGRSRIIKGKERKKNYPKKASIAQNVVKSLPDFSLPNPISKTEAINQLRTRVERLLDYAPLQSRMSAWGFKGEILKELLFELAPDDPRNGGAPRRTTAGLMKVWSEGALKELDEENQFTSSFYWDLEDVRHAFEAEGVNALDRICVNSYLRWLERALEGRKGSQEFLTQVRALLSLGDLRFAPLNFTLARSMTRHIHLHVGPTNSGKTHGALLALCKANVGIYAGPLRLLAHEVWDRINTGNVSSSIPPRACNLVTGEELKVTDELAGLTSCTVEMVNLSRVVDVAVIDEIQMIGDDQRGYAWTTAVLALPAKEMHLCGESSVIPLIKQLAEACGDKVYIHEYKRLTPLEVGQPLNGNLNNIKKGDCIVAFSRSEIFRLKKIIEDTLPFKCALAYGALPPETKSEQAKMFNDPENEVSVMVASDAIGMGLNLKIKRIIFSSLEKWNGSEMVSITASQIKQIAGRAGRYGTTGQNEQGGLATTLHSADIPILEAALAAPLVPITRAAIQPPSETLTQLSTILPAVKKMSQTHMKTYGSHRSLLQLFEDLSLLSRIDSSKYFMSGVEQKNALTSMLENAVPTMVHLPILQRELFGNAPASLRDEKVLALLANMVGYYLRSDLIEFEVCDSSLGMLRTLRSVEKLREGIMPNWYRRQREMDGEGEQSSPQETHETQATQETHETQESHETHETQETQEPHETQEPVDQTMLTPDIDALMILESLHRGLTLYLWFSFRLPLAFCFRTKVEEYKVRTELAIDYCLKAIKAGRAERMAKKEEEEDSLLKGDHGKFKKKKTGQQKVAFKSITRGATNKGGQYRFPSEADVLPKSDKRGDAASRFRV